MLWLWNSRFHSLTCLVAKSMELNSVLFSVKISISLASNSIHLKKKKLFFVCFVFLRTDKWAETEIGTKWGDKWEEKFFGGVGSRQGETWHVTPAGERTSHPSV